MPWGPHRQGGGPVPCAKQGGGTPPSPGPAAGWGLPTCSRCSIKLPPLPSHRFLIPGSQSAPPANGRAAPQNPERHWARPGMSPMAFTALLLLLLLGAGNCDMATSETTVETTTTETTTTETTTTDTTTAETTAETTAIPTITTPNVTISKTTVGNGNRTSISSHITVFTPATNTTNSQPGNSSAGNATAESTAVPVSSTAIISHANATTNGSNWITPVGTNTTNSSSAAPTPTAGAGTAIPISSATGNGTSSPRVVPTRETSVTSQGSPAPGQPSTAVPASSRGPSPSKPPAPLPTGVQLLLRVLLSFRILNRSFNESLRDPTSKEYRNLSNAVLTMYERVFGCASCVGGQTYKGCSELQFRHRGGDVPSTGACSPGLGHCSAGPGLHPAAAEHPHLLPDDHLHLPPEKPREAGPAQHKGFLPPHGRVRTVPEPRPLRVTQQQAQPLQPGGR
ncbi:mucin-2-like [Chroicocephalus ridibundus]|uniref:mucin-2-like n=1 Tax=Chroicocephalus ridibundus TaxID=1192867 RepID=UPI002FDD28F5